jgi:hypothetical protein
MLISLLFVDFEVTLLSMVFRQQWREAPGNTTSFQSTNHLHSNKREYYNYYYFYCYYYHHYYYWEISYAVMVFCSRILVSDGKVSWFCDKTDFCRFFFAWCWRGQYFGNKCEPPPPYYFKKWRVSSFWNLLPRLSPIAYRYLYITGTFLIPFFFMFHSFFLYLSLFRIFPQNGWNVLYLLYSIAHTQAFSFVVLSFFVGYEIYYCTGNTLPLFFIFSW